MRIDGDLFRSVLRELVDENPLACRGALGVARVELTDAVETLSVSLGKSSVIRANLAFMAKHCATEKHVKALLLHEFLHVLLGHTLRFDRMTPALNVALDSVINAIIHRKLGEGYSSMMSNYYAGARGLLQLLRPMDEAERRAATIASINRTPVDPLVALHAGLYNGTVLADDVLSIAADLDKRRIITLADGRPVFLGDHGRDPSSLGGCRSGEGKGTLRQALVALDAGGIFRDPLALRPQVLRPPVVERGIPPSWKSETLPILKRLVIPDPRGRVYESAERHHLLPMLNAGDRRGSLRSLWNPIIPDISWRVTSEGGRGAVQVYLDVSASMGKVLGPLVTLLASFGGHIRRPLWAFSTEVSEAVIFQGELRTRTTGGTRLGCVYDHLKKTRPERALVITDGYVEDGRPRDRTACAIEAIIPHDGHDSVLALTHGIPVTRLPPIPGGKP